MNEGWETLDAGDRAASELQPAPNRPSGLRQAREAAGLHIAALAAALKVPVKKLEALEAGRYEELPDLTFARALASSACRHLKIDPAMVLEMIPQAHAPTLGVTSNSMSTPFKADQGASSLAFLDRLKNPAFLTAMAVLLAALGLAFLPDWNQWPGKDWLNNGTRWVQGLAASDASPGGSENAPDNGETVTPAPVVATDSETPAAVGGIDTHLASLKSAVGLTETPEPNAATAGTVLHLEATSDSWVEVIDGVGKVQVQRVLKKGDVMDFSSTPPYSVVLGRADAVAVQVRGQVFDVAPFARNSVARFQVK